VTASLLTRRLERLEAALPENICAYDFGVQHFENENEWFRAAKAQQAALLRQENERNTRR